MARLRARWLRVFGSLLIAVTAAFAAAQEPAKPDQDKPKPDDPAKPAGSRDEHVVYVPFKDLKAVFEKEGAAVMLPYAQFLEMWAKLGGPPIALPVKPPVAGVITRADYAGAVAGDLVRIKATFTLELLGDEWARLPIQFGEAAVGEATSDDENVLVRGVGDGKYELLAKGRGSHKVSFELVARVTVSADGKSFAVACPAVGVSNLELEIPQAGQSVQVTPRRTSQVQPGDKEKTKIRATLGSTEQFTVSWRPESGAAAEMAGIASTSDTIEIDVGDGVVHTHATLDYQILRGSLDTLAVLLPDNHRLLDVQVPGLRDWMTEPADGRQRLTVRLHAPARDKLRLELRTETPLPDKPFPLAQIQAGGVARESGLIVVRSAEDVGLEFVTHEAVTRVDAGDAPESLRKPRSTFYKFFNPGFKLAVAATALEPRVSLESFTTVTIEKSRHVLRGDFKFDISRAGIFTVPLRLPAGFNVDDVQCPAMDRHETTAGDDGQTLTVYLTKKVLGELKIAVTASRPQTMASGDLDVPLIEPIGVPREQGLIAVIAPESLEVNSDAAKLESARPAPLAELQARGFTPQPPAGSVVAATFAFSRRPVKIALATRERPRRVLATVSTVVNIKEDVANVTARISYDIQFAGADTFRIAVPAAAADTVQIQGDGIKERRKADKPDDDGSTAWTVTLHAEALGNRVLTLTWVEKLTKPDKGETKFKLAPLRVLDVDRDIGEIAIQKDKALAIAPTVEGLEEIDPRELTQPVAGDAPYLSFKYVRHPASLELAVTKHELQDVVKTLVSRAYVETVVNTEGPMTVRARYMVKSSEKQRLWVSLPAKSVLGITVAGKSVQPEKAPAAPGAAATDRSYYINVSRETGPDVPFSLMIVYEMAAPAGGKLNTTDRLPLHLPTFDTGVKFQQLYARVWLPTKYRAVGEPDGFNNETKFLVDLAGFHLTNTSREDPNQWFAADAAGFDFRTAGHDYLYSSLSGPTEITLRYWHIPSMRAAGSVLVLVVGLVLVFFRVETKVFCLILAAVAALLAGLFWPEAVKSWLEAMRIGAGTVVGIWLVVFLLRLRHARPFALAGFGFNGGASTLTLGTPIPTPTEPPVPSSASSNSTSNPGSSTAAPPPPPDSAPPSGSNQPGGAK